MLRLWLWVRTDSRGHGRGRSVEDDAPVSESRLYIAGPISADPSRTVEEKLRLFGHAAEELREASYVVVSPVWIEPSCEGDCLATTKHPERVGEGRHSWECYMKADLRAMLSCNGIAVLPGWLYSPGARLEVNTGIAVGMDVKPVGEWVRR